MSGLDNSVEAKYVAVRGVGLHSRQAASRKVYR